MGETQEDLEGIINPKLEKSSEELNRGINEENWQMRFISLINQIPQTDNGNNTHSLLASFLEGVYNFYHINGLSITKFGEELRNVMQSIKPNLPLYLFTQKRHIYGKQQPSFVESVEATIKRYYIMEELKATFENQAQTIIIGGSMSYGPFYNVRSSQNGGSSDIDALVITEIPDLEEIDGTRIFSEQDRQIFLKRIRLFAKLRDEAEIFSQKNQVQGTNFSISLHFFDRDTLSKMVKGLEEKLEREEDSILVLNDYKARNFPYTICPQQGFDGKVFRYDVPTQREVNGGVIVGLPGYIINQGNFYPGLYQNLISPSFHVFYDPSGEITKEVIKLKKIMLSQLEKEKGANPTKHLLKSHIRHKIFSSSLFKKFN
ncbi:MAG: hypothetical protein ABIJ18_03140 [archaeon]